MCCDTSSLCGSHKPHIVTAVCAQCLLLLHLCPYLGIGKILCLPEVQIIHASLDISHVDVKGEEVDGCKRSSRQDFVEVGQSFARHAHVGRGRARRYDGGGMRCCDSNGCWRVEVGGGGVVVVVGCCGAADV